MKKIAVITGASSGMGREFVYAIDKDSELDELWVIARREERAIQKAKAAEQTAAPTDASEEKGGDR